ncbi:MAG: UDP-glucose 4-epimerase [Candidatus Heimdallarchaeota archaeon LC_3]|nr:MAG: UDP-glucose 4-epimerase [Candidatus Heimdallarchaeota archaeon LC_3]
MTNVLITGGAGYIGQIMAQYLLDKGFDVKILDNLLYDIPPQVDCKFIEGDILNFNEVKSAMTNVDHVIHLAAIANDPATDLDPRLSLMTNFESIKIIKKVTQKVNIDRFIFSSSCSVYGAKEEEISHETSEKNPITLYGKLKVDVENELLNSIHQQNFNPIIFRNATAFGLSPRTRLDLSINILTLHALKRRKFTIFGGNQWRPFVHIKDISHAFYLGLTKPLDLVNHKIFNVGSKELNFQMKSLVPLFKQHFPEAEGVIDEGLVDKRSYKVNFDKISTELGFKTNYSIDSGIEELKTSVKEGNFEDWETNTQYYCVKHLKKVGPKKFPNLFMGEKIYPL